MAYYIQEAKRIDATEMWQIKATQWKSVIEEQNTILPTTCWLFLSTVLICYTALEKLFKKDNDFEHISLPNSVLMHYTQLDIYYLL